MVECSMVNVQRSDQPVMLTLHHLTLFFWPSLSTGKAALSPVRIAPDTGPSEGARAALAAAASDKATIASPGRNVPEDLSRPRARAAIKTRRIRRPRL